MSESVPPDAAPAAAAPDAAADTAPAARKKKSRMGDYVIVLVMIAAVVAGAYYQQQLKGMLKLRVWDKAAPTQTVTRFLVAGKSGDQKTADSYLGKAMSGPGLKPLIKGGKLVGYVLEMRGGKTEYRFDQLVPAAGPKVNEVKFNYEHEAEQWAEVTAPNSKDKPVVYRLDMQDGRWKITGISGS